MIHFYAQVQLVQIMTVLNLSGITSKFSNIPVLLTVNIYKRMFHINPADTLKSVYIRNFAFVISKDP
jgi:hypothetical protein